MDELTFPVVDALKAAGSNPLTLAAFALLVGAMLVVALRVRRNRNLLQNLEKLPPRDRLAALKLEMGSVQVKGGLSAEQWLRQNSRMYLLGALIVVCITLVILVSVILGAMHEAKPKNGVRIELAPQSSSTPRATPGLRTVVWINDAAAPRTADDGVPAQRVVGYQAELDAAGVTRITYSSPYFQRLAAGGPVEGFNLLVAPFRWQFPQLSVTAANNSRGVMVLSEARIKVLEARPIDEVLPVVEDLSVDRLVLRNEGWATVIAPRVEFAVTDVQQAGEIPLFAPKLNAVDLATFGDRSEIALAPYLPEALKRRSVVQVAGTLAYGPPAARRSVRFSTRVSLQVRAGAGMPPSYTYDVLLTANGGGVTKQIGLAQRIAAGDTDHFRLRMASDRSARYRLHIDVVTVDGTVLPGGDFAIDIFVPRTAGPPLPADPGGSRS